jgi:hypothetical protein
MPRRSLTQQSELFNLKNNRHLLFSVIGDQMHLRLKEYEAYGLYPAIVPLATAEIYAQLLVCPWPIDSIFSCFSYTMHFCQSLS